MSPFLIWNVSCRCLIAALHFNENSGRKQQLTKDGEGRVAVSYYKHRNGDGVLKQVKTPYTYGEIIS